MLRDIRADHRLRRIARTERDKRARAANHTAIRHHIRSGEALHAQRFERLLLRRILARHAPLWRDQRLFATATHHRRDSEKSAVHTRCEIVRRRLSISGCSSAAGFCEGNMRVNEPRVDRGARHVMHARIRRHRDIRADRDDAPIAQKDRRFFQLTTGLDDDSAADQRVRRGRQRAVAGRTDFIEREGRSRAEHECCDGDEREYFCRHGSPHTVRCGFRESVLNCLSVRVQRGAFHSGGGSRRHSARAASV